MYLTNLEWHVIFNKNWDDNSDDKDSYGEIFFKLGQKN